MKKLLLSLSALIALTACGNSDGGSSSLSQLTNSGSLSSLISQLESNGSIPKLDRTNTVLGTITNSNGIRDDINNWINTLPDSPEQKRALIQRTKALQAALTVDDTNQSAVIAVSTLIDREVNCFGDKYPDYSKHNQRNIEAMLINTKQRFIAYEKYNTACSGMAFTMPKGNTCD